MREEVEVVVLPAGDECSEAARGLKGEIREGG